MTEGFRYFPQSLKINTGSALKQTTTVSFHILPKSPFIFMLYFLIRCYVS